MPAHFEIPPFLSHLKVDSRGYPIPFFVSWIKGKPEFRLLDVHKQEICIREHKCGICGKKLVKNVAYFISGPLGAKNQVSTDPPMHKECAEFSLQACPHMHFERADRRDANLPAGVEGNATQLLTKPDCIFCIYADKYKAIKNPAADGLLIKYHAVRISGYVYQNGVLTGVKFT